MTPPERRSRDALAAALQRREASALACAVHVGDALALDVTLGHARAFRLDAGGGGARLVAELAPEPVTSAHRFDVASVTKVVATTLAIMTLVGDGKLDLQAPLAQLLPLPRAPHPSQLRVWHLLTHRGGLPPWVPLYFDVSRREALLPALAPYVAAAVPEGERVYSDLGFLLLGALVEAVSGEQLDAYLQRRVCAPLGLGHCGFVPRQAAPGAPVVATGHGNRYERRMIDEPDFGLRLPSSWPARPSAAFAGWRERTLVGEVDDGNAHYAMQGVAGHAGLFATARDVSVLAQALVGPPTGKAARALDVAAPVRRQFAGRHACGDYLGWFDAAALGAGALAPGSVMMRGFTGCVVVYSPAQALTVTVLGNRQHVVADANYVNLRPLFAEICQSWAAARPVAQGA